MKVAVIVTGGLHPSGREQVVPSWLTLFAELATTHEVHAFVLRHGETQAFEDGQRRPIVESIRLPDIPGLDINGHSAT